MIQKNTTDLQTILETAKNLPESVNLDDEISEQDELISQIVTELSGKAAGGTVQTAIVTVEHNIAMPVKCIYYDGEHCKEELLSNNNLESSLTKTIHPAINSVIVVHAYAEDIVETWYAESVGDGLVDYNTKFDLHFVSSNIYLFIVNADGLIRTDRDGGLDIV